MPHRRFTGAGLLLGTLVVGAFAANSLAPMILPASPARQSPEDIPPGLTAVTIPVKGMTCFTCELHVQNVLTDMPGVETADASTANASAAVTFDPHLVTVADLVNTLNTRTGYRATLPTAETEE